MSEARLPVISGTDYRSDPDRTDCSSSLTGPDHVDPVLTCTCSVRPLTTCSLLTASKHIGNKTNTGLTQHLPSVRFHELQECKPEGRSRKSSETSRSWENARHNPQQLFRNKLTEARCTVTCSPLRVDEHSQNVPKSNLIISGVVWSEKFRLLVYCWFIWVNKTLNTDTQHYGFFCKFLHTEWLNVAFVPFLGIF